MIISKITPSKQHLNNVSFSDGSEISLDKDLCILKGLYPDMEICQEDIKELSFESDRLRARSRALWYLDRMDYTEKRLFEKLISKGFDKKACAAVLADLVEKGIVDDRRYAERFAERLMEADTSKREALQKMLYRGIPYDLAKEILADFHVDEEEQLKEMIDKKYLSKLQGENGYQKVYGALVRKGFSYSSVRNALKNYISEDNYV